MGYGAHYTIKPKGVELRVVLYSRAFRIWGYDDGQQRGMKEIQIKNVLERIEMAFDDIPAQHIKAVAPVLYIKVHDDDYFKDVGHGYASAFVNGRRWNLDIPAERVTIHIRANKFTEPSTRKELRGTISHEFGHCVEYLFTRKEDNFWAKWFTIACMAAEQKEAMSLSYLGYHMKNKFEFFAEHYQYYYQKRTQLIPAFHPRIKKWFSEFDESFGIMTLLKGAV